MNIRESTEYKLEIGNRSTLLDHKKVKLLKYIEKHGSIMKASKETGVPYRTALKYIEKIENELSSPVVSTKRGGKGGGGESKLTDMGKFIIREHDKFDSILKKHVDVNEIQGYVSGIDIQNKVIKITSNGKKITIPGFGNLDIGDKVLILISPEDIFVMLKPQESSVRNILEGKIIEMKFQNGMVRLSINLGEKISIFADITKYSMDKLKLHLGKKIFVGFKATSMAVVKI